MRPLRVIVWAVAVAALVGWSQIVLGVAVFAIPNRYGAPESIVFGLMALAIGVAVPLAAFWLVRAVGVSGARGRKAASRRFPARMERLAYGRKA